MKKQPTQRQIDKARTIIQDAMDKTRDVFPNMVIIAYQEGEFEKRNGIIPTLRMRGIFGFTQKVMQIMGNKEEVEE
jgi:hypothetical protein